MENSRNSITPENIFKRMIPAFLLGFLVLLVVSFLGDIQKITKAIIQFNWTIFPLVLVFTLFNYFLRFIKWHFYVHKMGVSKLSLFESARLFIAGFPLALTPGKVGEVLKAVWLNNSTGISIPKGISIVMAERISDGLAVLFLSLLGVLAYPQFWPVFLFVLLILLLIIIFFQNQSFAYWIIAFLKKIPLLKRISSLIHDFYEGSFSLFQPKATFLAVMIGMISWLGEGIGFYLILINLGLTPGKETLGSAIFILSFSTIIGAVSALPGGLGAAEVTIAGMLALILGVDATFSSLATLLIRLATLWFGVGIGLICWAFSLKFFGFKGGKNEFNKI